MNQPLSESVILMGMHPSEVDETKLNLLKLQNAKKILGKQIKDAYAWIKVR